MLLFFLAGILVLQLVATLFFFKVGFLVGSSCYCSRGSNPKTATGSSIEKKQLLKREDVKAETMLNYREEALDVEQGIPLDRDVIKAENCKNNKVEEEIQAQKTETDD